MNTGYIRLDATVLCGASVVGKKEREGNFGKQFDLFDPTDLFGAKTWEAAEGEMQRAALNIALSKGRKMPREIGALFAGDLQNQCVGSAYGLLSFDIPYFGLYGACSTCAESLLLASVFASNRLCDCSAAVTSSHFCAAERQFRMPLEYGSQRAPTAQWTVTGAGAFLLTGGKTEKHAHVVSGMGGIVVEKGITDVGNMGAAMAPAAEHTLLRFFEASGKSPGDYDRIVTGDLGFEGGQLLCELLETDGVNIRGQYADCGQMIYKREEQDVHSGGSGCGCSAVVMAAELLPKLVSGEWKKILFLATGAMMSPDSIKQGKAIPAVAHLLEIEGV